MGEAKYERAKADFDAKMEAFKAAGGEVQKRTRKSNKKVKEGTQGGVELETAWQQDPNRPKKPAGGAYGVYLAQHRDDIRRSLPDGNKAEEPHKTLLWPELEGKWMRMASETISKPCFHRPSAELASADHGGSQDRRGTLEGLVGGGAGALLRGLCCEDAGLQGRHGGLPAAGARKRTGRKAQGCGNGGGEEAGPEGPGGWRLETGTDSEAIHLGVRVRAELTVRKRPRAVRGRCGRRGIYPAPSQNMMTSVRHLTLRTMQTPGTDPEVSGLVKPLEPQDELLLAVLASRCILESEQQELAVAGRFSL